MTATKIFIRNKDKICTTSKIGKYVIIDWYKLLTPNSRAYIWCGTVSPMLQHLERLLGRAWHLVQLVAVRDGFFFTAWFTVRWCMVQKFGYENTRMSALTRKHSEMLLIWEYVLRYSESSEDIFITICYSRSIWRTVVSKDRCSNIKLSTL